VYGVAVVEGTFFVRTGTELICVREPVPAKRP
jgi:outer membrane protein assembly factor BamB